MTAHLPAPAFRTHRPALAAHLAAALVMTSAACGGGEESSSPPPSNPPTPPETFVFDCAPPEADPFSFTIRHLDEDQLALWIPPEVGEVYQVLQRVPAASGARYEADSVLVWNRGEEAMLEVGTPSFQGCTLDRAASIWEGAKLDGVDFRAVGNEPGWHLEIRERDRIRFVYDYGNSEVLAVAPVLEEDPGARRASYRAAAPEGPLVVTLVGTPCSDTMSGEEFSTTVTVEWDGRVFSGCGRPLH